MSSRACEGSPTSFLSSSLTLKRSTSFVTQDDKRGMVCCMDISKLLECHPEPARDLLLMKAVRSFVPNNGKRGDGLLYWILLKAYLNCIRSSSVCEESYTLFYLIYFLFSYNTSSVTSVAKPYYYLLQLCGYKNHKRNSYEKECRNYRSSIKGATNISSICSYLF
jgi:hypothetical protein